MGSINQLPPKSDRDEVFPVHQFDDTALNRIMNVTGLFRFDAVLEANKLRDSLSTLLHVGDWRKLRGRLRLNDQDKLEVHVPRKATRQRPPIRYRQTVFGLPANNHPLMARLAQPQPISSTQPALASYEEVATVLIPPEWPRTLADYVDPIKDEPILGLHVLSFTDKTVVVLTYSHVLMDGGGIESLVTAWSKIMRHDHVAAIVGARHDPLDAIFKSASSSRDSKEECVLENHKIELAALMPEDGQAPPTDPHWNTKSPDSQWRTLSLSPRAVSQLRKEAEAYTKATDKFASEDDIVAAWIIQTVAGLLPESRPINAMRVYDMRRRLPELAAPKTAYMQNLFQMAWALFPSAGSAASAPLGAVAVQLRDSLVQQTTEAQVAAAMRARVGGVTPLYGSASGMFFTLNSWVKMNLYRNVDFGPAVVAGAPQGHPEFIDFDFSLGGAPPGPNVIFTGKDASGTRHAMAFLSDVMWPRVEAELARLEQQEESSSYCCVQ